MTDTPTKQEIQSKNDNVPGAMPVEQKKNNRNDRKRNRSCLLYTSPSPRDRTRSRMPSSA